MLGGTPRDDRMHRADMRDTTSVCRVSNVPDNEAKRGDVYHVSRVAITKTRDPKPGRPVVCVAELPDDIAVWRGMPRLTHGQTDVDLPSDPDPQLGLSKRGWWTWRFVHAVKKSATGKQDCSFKGSLKDPEKSRVLNHYMDRHKQNHNN